ncbi:MAG: AAA family ATPase [Verrucomicrobiota bacterium]
MPRKLIIITGSSGVGKTTLARALQEELLPDQWLHFSIDSIFYCLPPSVVVRVDQHNDRTLVDSNAIVRASHACTTTLLDLGHKIIFDSVIVTERGAHTMLSRLGVFDPLLVELTCSWEVIRERTLARGDRTVAEAENGYRNATGHIKAHHTFDSTSTSAKELAALLAAKIRNGNRTD